ncbi:MAG: hypothetical protein HY842_00810 [Bacteroidetes bacterium]|nr:hypothetical protein [Bacteroidota bacterium]
MKTLLTFLLPLFALAFLVACKETPDDYEADAGLEYFPLEVGKFIEYEVDSTIYDPNGDTTVFSSKTFVREEVLDTLSDNNGNTLYKIERYERAADTLPWQVEKVLTMSVQGSQAIRTEDNLRFIKLTFPVRENETWDGNVHFNTSLIVTVAGESLEMFKGWNYRITEVGEPAVFGGFQFAETATVQEADSENLIELRTSKSTYAKGIGLVYRELWILDTQCIEPCGGQPWEEKAEKGFILKQIIIAHN